MNAKTTIRKILFIAVWLCIGGGMVTLLLAAISKKNKGRCKDYSITIKGAKNNLFIDQKDVEQLLVKSTGGAIKGQPIASFKLNELENMLDHNTWISRAELYFDNQDVLHVTVTEKEPVARLFTVAGNSFYIDSSAAKMPLSDKLSARVPVFTGFPDKKVLSAKDSVLLDNVRQVANYIFTQPFWMSQVAQIDITPQGTFEMIPVVGNHIVKLGDAENIEKKFRRLMIFYQQVLSNTGFDAYKVIDVQYAGQVVANRFAGDAKVDSVQLRKNVEKLLQASREAEADTVVRTLPVVQPTLTNDDDASTVEDAPAATTTNDNPEHDSPNPRLSNASPAVPNRDGGVQAAKPATVVKKPVAKPVTKPATNATDKPKPAANNRQPRAVMPKRPNATEDNRGYN